MASKKRGKIRKYCGHPQCTEGGLASEPIEFVGDVKIVLIDSPRWQYRQTAWTTTMISFAYFTMGACVMMIIYFGAARYHTRMTSKSTIWHAWLYSISFEFLLMLSNLIMNRLNITSVYLSSLEKELYSAVLRYLSWIFTWIGFLVLLFGQPGFLFRPSFHSFTGVMAVLFTIPEILSFYTEWFKERQWAGIIAKYAVIFFATLCFCSAFYKTPIVKFLIYKHSKYILVLFCLFYTIVAIYKNIKNLIDPEYEDEVLAGPTAAEMELDRDPDELPPSGCPGTCLGLGFGQIAKFVAKNKLQNVKDCLAKKWPKKK